MHRIIRFSAPSIALFSLLFLASCAQPAAQKTAENNQRCQQLLPSVQATIQAYDVQKNAGHDPASWHETSKLDAIFYSSKTQSCLYTWTSTNYQKDHLYSTKMYLSDVKTNQLILQCFHISSDLDTCAQFQTDLSQYKK